jgi:hypothetical protein
MLQVDRVTLVLGGQMTLVQVLKILRRLLNSKNNNSNNQLVNLLFKKLEALEPILLSEFALLQEAEVKSLSE